MPSKHKTPIDKSGFSPTVTTPRGGVAARCQARSKRHGGQCGAMAVRGKAVCKTHGGRSTGPKNPHCPAGGTETVAKRKERAEAIARIRFYGVVLGIPQRGRKTKQGY